MKTAEKSTPTKTKMELIAEKRNPRKERAKIADPTYPVIVPYYLFICDVTDFPKAVELYREDEKPGMKMSVFMKGKSNDSEASKFPFKQCSQYGYSPPDHEQGTNTVYVALCFIVFMYPVVSLTSKIFFSLQVTWKAS